MELKVSTNSAEQTMKIAGIIGAELKGGEIFVLLSDLGGGKTTFTKGLVEELGSEDNVTSPTFTLSQVYIANNLEIHHYDFYRLGDNIGIMLNEISEVISAPNAITVIEWPEAVVDGLPSSRLVKVEINRIADSEDGREIFINYPTQLKYLFRKLGKQ